MKLAFLIIATLVVLSAKFIAEDKQKAAIYETDIERYRNAANFFDGVFLGMLIVAAIVEFIP